MGKLYDLAGERAEREFRRRERLAEEYPRHAAIIGSLIHGGMSGEDAELLVMGPGQLPERLEAHTAPRLEMTRSPVMRTAAARGPPPSRPAQSVATEEVTT
jgi:hypothetical protein